MKRGQLIIVLAMTFALSGADAICRNYNQPSIDRHELVSRHDISIQRSMKFSPAQVGNGKFAFGMDISGLQSFIPFNTLSDWSWHSSPLPKGVRIEDYKPVVYETHGRSIAYQDFNKETEESSQYLRSNPHRVNLGRLGFRLIKEDGSLAEEKDLTDTEQYTELWTGEISSRFSLEGKEVKVKTICDPDLDQVSIRVQSALPAGRLAIFIEFPYYDEKGMTKYVGDYQRDDAHQSALLSCSPREAVINHTMDDLSYDVKFRWDGQMSICKESAHRYILLPSESQFELGCLFTQNKEEEPLAFDRSAERARKSWEEYWMSGAALDLSGSRDPRWKELERRVVLSQYLMRLNESGLYPPQESGLVNNGWYGRYHFEMIWWHAAHYFQWGRSQYCERYLGVYRDFLPGARERAAQEGRTGARWPKCTANFNREWPCDAHAFLIWQEPHPIYFAEMAYRSAPTAETLDKWGEIVLETADYMADYVFWDGKRYVIGPPVTAVSENTKPLDTLNPIFELAYFRFGLKTAIAWAKRMQLAPERSAKWRKVLKNLADYPKENGYYITEENMSDMWTKHNYEHPAISGLYGWLPGDGVDKRMFRRTFYKILDCWQMDKIWGWDFPMLAMSAARLGDTAKAIDLLTTTQHKFGFDAHGLADTWPFPYFPANGGLLSAVAMMCEGWDGSRGEAPGFPKDGTWTVRYEGFNKML